MSIITRGLASKLLVTRGYGRFWDSVRREFLRGISKLTKILGRSTLDRNGN